MPANHELAANAADQSQLDQAGRELDMDLSRFGVASLIDSMLCSKGDEL